MTPREWAEQAYVSAMANVTSNAGIDAIEIRIRAALRERDAEHEIALKKARADALEEAAATCRSVARVRKLVRHDNAGSSAALACVEALRALLEEAGK